MKKFHRHTGDDYDKLVRETCAYFLGNSKKHIRGKNISELCALTGKKSRQTIYGYLDRGIELGIIGIRKDSKSGRYERVEFTTTEKFETFCKTHPITQDPLVEDWIKHGLASAGFSGTGAVASQSHINAIAKICNYCKITPTQLIHMKGYKKLVVTMSASNIKLPENLNFSDVLDKLNYNYTGSITGSQELPPITKETRFDFKYPEMSSRLFDLIPLGISTENITTSSCRVYYPLQYNRGGFYYTYSYERKATYVRTYNVYESDDINFSSETLLQNNVSISELRSIAGSKRFIRIVETMVITVVSSYSNSTHTNVNSNSSSSTTCPTRSIGNFFPTSTTFGNVIDKLLSGGSAKLSFEILDISSGQWMEFIPHLEFGTITYGEQILSQIGDVTTKSQSNKTYAIPSTQTDFRAKLIVVGGIQTGVSFQKIS